MAGEPSRASGQMLVPAQFVNCDLGFPAFAKAHDQFQGGILLGIQQRSNQPMRFAISWQQGIIKRILDHPHQDPVPSVAAGFRRWIDIRQERAVRQGTHRGQNDVGGHTSQDMCPSCQRRAEQCIPEKIVIPRQQHPFADAPDKPLGGGAFAHVAGTEDRITNHVCGTLDQVNPFDLGKRTRAAITAIDLPPENRSSW